MAGLPDGLKQVGCSVEGNKITFIIEAGETKVLFMERCEHCGKVERMKHDEVYHGYYCKSCIKHFNEVWDLLEKKGKRDKRC